jgi:hypothetical protein
VAGPLAKRPDLAFFGEAPTLVLISVAAMNAEGFEDLCERAGVPCYALGRVGGDELVLGWGAAAGDGGAGNVAAREGAGGGGRDGLRVPVARLADVYESALPRAMGD